MRRFEFHPEARAEYLAAMAYYDEVNVGLGAEFAREMEGAIELVLSFPSAWPIMGGEVRRCLLGRFPFGIIYTVVDEVVLILAIAHVKRAPGYWRSRRE